MNSTRQKIRTMTAAGIPPRDIAAALDISVQRVYFLLADMDLEPAPSPRDNKRSSPYVQEELA